MPGQKEKSGGSRSGAGRKPKSQEEELQILLRKGWSAKQRLEAIQKLATLAALGNLEAIKLLMGYTFGKPKERHEHSGPDRSPIPISLTGALDKFYGDDGAESD
jgi:hypothetical protein